MPNQSAYKMRYFPIFVDTLKSRTLVIGKNQSAIQKVRLLLKTRTQINVFCGEQYNQINGEFSRQFQDLLINGHSAEHARIRFINLEELSNSALTDFRLIYHAPDDDDFSANEAAFIETLMHQASDHNRMINVIDSPEDCSFITPCIVDRSPLTVAIGTEGISPTLAQKVKTQLETWLPKNIGAYLLHAKCLRPGVLNALPLSSDRREFWRAFFSDYFTRLFFQNKTSHHHNVKALFSDIFKKTASSSEPKSDGIPHKSNTLVSFVGAGPGDPELLTLKAVQKLQQADVIIYDRLIDDNVLEYARRDALRINVGKEPGAHSITQEEINKLLQTHAQTHRFIVRLKGGDPLIFGRISEEIQALESIGVDYDIVPGITAAFGCAASAAMTLTHRDNYHGLQILSGHSKTGMPEYDWQSLARLDTPLVFYMAVKYSSAIQQKLLEAGIGNEIVVTIIENGLRPNEKVLVSDMSSFTDAMRDNNISGPAIIYIGLKPSPNKVSNNHDESLFQSPKITSNVTDDNLSLVEKSLLIAEKNHLSTLKSAKSSLANN